MRRKSMIPVVVATALMTASGTAKAQHAGHGRHPPMPDQRFVIRCGFEQDGEARQIEVPLGLTSPTMPADLTQVIELPQPYTPIHFTQYLPQATLEQSVVPGEKGMGTPAV